MRPIFIKKITTFLFIATCFYNCAKNQLDTPYTGIKNNEISPDKNVKVYESSFEHAGKYFNKGFSDDYYNSKKTYKTEKNETLPTNYAHFYGLRTKGKMQKMAI